MGRFRCSLLDLVLLVAAVGVGLQTWREYGGRFAEELVYATFLGLLAITSLGVIVRKPLRRPIFVGFAAYAWIYLILGLLIADVEDLQVSSWIGMGYGAMVGVVVRWITPGGPFGPPHEAKRDEIVEHRPIG
ncbi:hypothetical protein P12x_002462 [Tundrisphaera lichenicola]|uniref:hypothetical protein n=1 Tax=Tundrisphaera lichenicola TaxID=2029860 RepID=UPI003EBE03C6